MESGVIRREIALWPSELESSLFGTEDPDAIEGLIRAHCSEHLGRPLKEILFYRRGVGAVFGVRVEGGDGIVVKVHRADLVGLATGRCRSHAAPSRDAGTPRSAAPRSTSSTRAWHRDVRGAHRPRRDRQRARSG